MKRLIAVFIFVSQLTFGAPIITYFFHEYPMTKERAQQMAHKLRKPHGIAKRTLEGLTRHYSIAGIFSTYFGFLQVSNANGQTTFPRKQSKPSLQVVITNKITPVMMFANTISHWELETGTPAAMYTYELKTDEQTKLLYWDVKKAALPENNQIDSIDSIVIIAKPKNVYIPEGITLTTEDANLILPDMYIKKGIKLTRNALYMLNLASFFRPVDMLYKIRPKSYGVMVEEY